MSQTILNKDAEIERNLTYFREVLPQLLTEHDGEYALLRHGLVVDFFPSPIAAQIAGNQRFDDHQFSIQLVKDAAEELGFYSYALRSG